MAVFVFYFRDHVIEVNYTRSFYTQLLLYAIA